MNKSKSIVSKRPWKMVEYPDPDPALFILDADGREVASFIPDSGMIDPQDVANFFAIIESINNFKN